MMLLKQSTLDRYREDYGRPMDSYMKDEMEETLQNVKHFNTLEEACRYAIKDDLDVYKASSEYSEGGPYVVLDGNGNIEHFFRLCGFDFADKNCWASAIMKAHGWK